MRQGAAAAITVADTLLPQRGVADLSAALSINDAPGAAVSVRLRGPADVVGIDARQIVRIDPHPDTSDFEPNYFACIEFDRPDFPWLFTPARANASGQLRPWLCLVVVREQDGVAITPASASSLPVLRITSPANPADELPDLTDCWAWAHAQVAAADTSAATVRTALRGATELSLSRLLCPRLLEPDTDYIACVVPTFELGRRAGLGDTLAESDVTAANALAAAWSMDHAAGAAVPAGRCQVPVYHHWRFKTGASGDFESLARRLHPQPAPERLGLRPIDISQPGFALAAPLAEGTTIDLEGALKPMDAPSDPPAWPAGRGERVPDGARRDRQRARPGGNRRSARRSVARTAALRPMVCGAPTVSPTAASWLDELNLDPRYRAIAAFGTHVVQEHQEALMASAWEQAAELQRSEPALAPVAAEPRCRQRAAREAHRAARPEALLRVARRRSDGCARRCPGSRRENRRRADRVIGIAGAGDEHRDAPHRTRARAADAAPQRAGHQAPRDRHVDRQAQHRTGAIFTTVPTPTLATINAIRQRLAANANIASFGAVTGDTVANMRGRPLFRVMAEGQPVPVAPLQGLPPSADSAAARDFRPRRSSI